MNWRDHKVLAGAPGRRVAETMDASIDIKEDVQCP